jgi:hypothetical protein
VNAKGSRRDPNPGVEIIIINKGRARSNDEEEQKLQNDFIPVIIGVPLLMDGKMFQLCSGS